MFFCVVGVGHSRQAEHAGQGGLLLPSSEHSHPVGSSQVRGDVGSSRAWERVRTDSNGRGAYHSGRQGQN